MLINKKWPLLNSKIIKRMFNKVYHTVLSIYENNEVAISKKLFILWQ